MKAKLAFLFCLLGSMVHGQEIFGGDGKAFIVTPAIAISNSVVLNSEWSSNSRFLVYQRVPWSLPTLNSPPDFAKVQTYIWDTQTKSSIQMPDAVSYAFWSNDVLVLQKATATTFYDPVSTKTLTIGESANLIHSADDNFPHFVFSQKDRIVCLSRDWKREEFATTGQNILSAVPAKTAAGQLLLRCYIANGETGKWDYFKLDANTRSLSLVLNPVIAQPPAPKAVPKRSDYFLEVTDKFRASIDSDLTKPASKSSALNRVIEIEPFSKVNIAPNKSQFVYQDNGALLLRAIEPVDPALAEKIEVARLKTEALNIAKQVGIACIIFASDMSDNLPTQEDFLKVRPYLKNDKMLNRFTYLLNGQNLTSFENPDKTILGYVTGPGGRANVYADGHAKWQPDK